MALQAVLCDIGGIVATHDDDRTVSLIAKASPYGAEIIRRLLFGTDGMVPSYAKGNMTTEQFRTQVRDVFTLGKDFTDAMVDDAFAGGVVLHQGAAMLLTTLRHSGVVVTAVANTEPLRYDSIERTGILACFDETILSFEEGMLKPSEELLIRALDLSGAQAEHAAYVDDRPPNLAPARDLGMHVHHYTDLESFADFLGGFDVPGSVLA